MMKIAGRSTGGPSTRMVQAIHYYALQNTVTLNSSVIPTGAERFATRIVLRSGGTCYSPAEKQRSRLWFPPHLEARASSPVQL